MKYTAILFSLISTIYIPTNETYKILCLFPFNGKSHFRMFGTLCRGLAKKGHQIDMISFFPTMEPIANYTDIIDLRGTSKGVQNSLTVQEATAMQTSMTYYIATKYGGDLCNILGHEKVQNFIKNQLRDPRYNLLITEYLGSPCYLGFGPLLNTPVAIAISFLEAPYVDHFMNNPFNFAIFPGSMVEDAVLNTFSDRLWNTFANVKEMLKFYYYTSDQTTIMRKYLGQNIPSVRELEKNISLALVNSHHTFHGVRPLTRAVIEVGGLHIEGDESRLTGEIRDWLESADHGLVYFTLGSLVNIESLPKKTLLSLYSSFAKISPVKILMRCANAAELPPNRPDNVMISPWIPQISVLRHKNTRVFVTHGGLMGTQEAFYYGVPMIGIPVFADQMRNVNIMVHKNMGILMLSEGINEHSMDAALDEVLHNPKYREAARKVSELFKDRPTSALNTGIYWIEYVIRNGPHSLKFSATNIPWWKLNSVDIFVVLITCIVLVIYLSLKRTSTLLKQLYDSHIRSKKNVIKENS